jgi:hypothetical protein
MPIRFLLTILGVMVIAASLLALRQHRLSMLHEMAQLHAQMDRDRKAAWISQSQIAESTHPEALREAMDRRGLMTAPLPGRSDAAAVGPERMPYQSAVAQPIPGGERR